jgi:hypothetical protein
MMKNSHYTFNYREKIKNLQFFLSFPQENDGLSKISLEMYSGTFRYDNNFSPKKGGYPVMEPKINNIFYLNSYIMFFHRDF